MEVTGIVDSKLKAKPEPTRPLTSIELPIPPPPFKARVADPVRLELNTALASELNRLEPTKRMVPPNVFRNPSVTSPVAVRAPLRYISEVPPLTDRSRVLPARLSSLTYIVPDDMVRISPGCGAPVGDQSFGLDALSFPPANPRSICHFY